MCIFPLFNNLNNGQVMGHCSGLIERPNICMYIHMYSGVIHSIVRTIVNTLKLRRSAYDPLNILDRVLTLDVCMDLDISSNIK